MTKSDSFGANSALRRTPSADEQAFDTRLDLSVVIFSLNDEIQIVRAIDSVGFAKQILILDFGSNDRTAEMARLSGAEVCLRDASSGLGQLTWALQIPYLTEWVMFLNADEAFPPELKNELTAVLPALPKDVAGVKLRMQQLFQGTALRHGGCTNSELRIWRNGQAIIRHNRRSAATLSCLGKTITLQHSLFRNDLHDLTQFVQKTNQFSKLEALDIVSSGWPPALSYEKLPYRSLLGYKPSLAVAASLSFLFRYFVLLGFLDGKAGLIFHLLNASHCVSIHVVQLELLEQLDFFQEPKPSNDRLMTSRH